ncbi:MAG: hypothetical protein U1E45_20680 [Geminicoccaceae bacterium]
MKYLPFAFAALLAAAPLVAHAATPTAPAPSKAAADLDDAAAKVGEAADKVGQAVGEAQTKVAGAAPNWTFEDVVGADVNVDAPVSPWAMGVGALAGVVGFNLLQQYVVPGFGGLGGTWLAETDIAASRIYAVGSAVVGALAGQAVYDQVRDKP